MPTSESSNLALHLLSHVVTIYGIRLSNDYMNDVTNTKHHLAMTKALKLWIKASV